MEKDNILDKIRETGTSEDTHRLTKPAAQS
jgi:hypothetical protein